MVTAWLSLGSNLQGSATQLKQALRRLRRADGIDSLEVSSFYRTPPWGDSAQDDFVNAAVRLETRLSAQALLRLAQTIENDMGRIRDGRRWGPRVIDIDLLLYGARRIRDANLEVPHPRMHTRAFVLLPMAELDSELEIPGRGRLRGLLEGLDKSGIRRLTERE